MAAEFPLKIEMDNAVGPPHRARCRDDEGGEVAVRKKEGKGSSTTWQHHRDAALGRKRAKIEE